jgi:SHAQKYF class myb-like DNA-binding protein
MSSKEVGEGSGRHIGESGKKIGSNRRTKKSLEMDEEQVGDGMNGDEIKSVDGREEGVDKRQGGLQVGYTEVKDAKTNDDGANVHPVKTSPVIGVAVKRRHRSDINDKDDENVQEKMIGRKREPCEDGGAEDEDDEDEGDKKMRLVWTQELHNRFINALSHLGLKQAVPKNILGLMNVEGMTRENVASHLQKYRLYLKKIGGYTEKDKVDHDDLQKLHEVGFLLHYLFLFKKTADGTTLRVYCVQKHGITHLTISYL